MSQETWETCAEEEKEIERQAQAEALRWVAAELDAQVEEARQDWVGVLIKSSVRARITALLETATMCRVAAAHVEHGASLISGRRA